MARIDKGAVFATQFSLSRKTLVKQMALIIFKYCLPILLGYTLFVGISGRYVPFIRPRTLARRPSWFLGLWTGISVAALMTFALHLAYQMNLSDMSELLAPGAWILGAAMLPGVLCFLWYRTSIARQINIGRDRRMTDQIDIVDAHEYDDTMAIDNMTSSELDETLRVEPTTIVDIDDQTTIWADMTDFNTELAEHDETQLFEVDPATFSEPVLIDETAVEPIELEAQPLSQLEIDAVAIEVDSQPETLSAEAFARHTAEQSTAMIEMKRLRESLEEESRVRKELETHLRITRKGLAELDSESREFESQKAMALTQMEQELEEKVKRTAAAEARAEREATKSASLESELVLLRQDTLKATKDSRESVEARARALSTANKATTIARQAMDIRSRLETQVHDAESELDSKQQTISSLIGALEKEKARTQDQVTSMAKQLILHEKQLQARRTLEEVSRSVDNKLSTRLVKKVAKARG